MNKKNNFLKGAGVLLIAIMIILTSIITVTAGMKIKSTTFLSDKKVTEKNPIMQMVIMEEDFSGAFPPYGWTTDYWTKSDTNEAGGEPPEARVYKYDQYYSGQYYDNYIMTPAIGASDYENLVLEFKFAADTYYPEYCFFYVTYRNDSDNSWIDITPCTTHNRRCL